MTDSVSPPLSYIDYVLHAVVGASSPGAGAKLPLPGTHRPGFFSFEINVQFPVVRRRSECNSSVTVSRAEVQRAAERADRSRSAYDTGTFWYFRSIPE